jgi:hypothetical protein
MSRIVTVILIYHRHKAVDPVRLCIWLKGKGLSVHVHGVVVSQLLPGAVFRDVNGPYSKRRTFDTTDSNRVLILRPPMSTALSGQLPSTPTDDMTQWLSFEPVTVAAGTYTQHGQSGQHVEWIMYRRRDHWPQRGEGGGIELSSQWSYSSNHSSLSPAVSPVTTSLNIVTIWCINNWPLPYQ